MWQLIYRSAWVALFVMGLVGASVAFIPKWQEHRALQRQRAAAEEALRDEEEMLKVLKMKQERFQRDPRFVEQIAHDLGMAKPDEVIFKFHDEAVAAKIAALTNAPPSPPPAATNRPTAAARPAATGRAAPTNRPAAAPAPGRPRR
jgi:cell division protein FtsB